MAPPESLFDDGDAVGAADVLPPDFGDGVGTEGGLTPPVFDPVTVTREGAASVGV